MMTARPATATTTLTSITTAAGAGDPRALRWMILERLERGEALPTASPAVWTRQIRRRVQL